MGSMTIPRRTLMGYILSAATGRSGSNEKWRQGGAGDAGGQAENASWATPAQADGMHLESVLKRPGMWPARPFQAMVEQLWDSPKRH